MSHEDVMVEVAAPAPMRFSPEMLRFWPGKGVIGRYLILGVMTVAITASLCGCSTSAKQATEAQAPGGQATSGLDPAPSPPQESAKPGTYSAEEAKYSKEMARVAQSVSEANDGIDAIMSDSSNVEAILKGNQGLRADLSGHIEALATAEKDAKALTVPNRFKSSQATYLAGLKLLVVANGHLMSALDNSNVDEMRTAREQINNGSLLIGEAKAQLDQETAGMQ